MGYQNARHRKPGLRSQGGSFSPRTQEGGYELTPHTAESHRGLCGHPAPVDSGRAAQGIWDLERLFFLQGLSI